ncbi:MAG TPA: hypothetical protein VML55_05875 [Planctomycetaceae bacterium]|nr:hypothetical protein [Planctomycetaceae bacterium]
MRVIAKLAALWRNLLHRSRLERDLNDEILETYELLTADRIEKRIGARRRTSGRRH